MAEKRLAFEPWGWSPPGTAVPIAGMVGVMAVHVVDMHADAPDGSSLPAQARGRPFYVIFAYVKA